MITSMPNTVISEILTMIYMSRYNGNVNSALKMLNKARNDPVYGQKSIILIAEIYLNPTSVVLGGDAFVVDSSSSGDGSLANSSSVDSKELTAKTVETLLRVSNSK